MQHFFFAKNKFTGEACCFATKYAPATNTRPARFKWWEINGGFERIGDVCSKSWSHSVEFGEGHEGQLVIALGADWKIYPFHQVLNLL